MTGNTVVCLGWGCEFGGNGLASMWKQCPPAIRWMSAYRGLFTNFDLQSMAGILGCLANPYLWFNLFRIRCNSHGKAVPPSTRGPLQVLPDKASGSGWLHGTAVQATTLRLFSILGTPAAGRPACPCSSLVWKAPCTPLNTGAGMHGSCIYREWYSCIGCAMGLVFIRVLREDLQTMLLGWTAGLTRVLRSPR